MILDIEMLRSFYASYSANVAQAKATVKRPLTYAEKVLFAHLLIRRNSDHIKEV